MSFCISLWSHCSFGTSSHTSQLCLIDVSTRIFPYFFFFLFSNLDQEDPRWTCSLADPDVKMDSPSSLDFLLLSLCHDDTERCTRTCSWTEKCFENGSYIVLFPANSFLRYFRCLAAYSTTSEEAAESVLRAQESLLSTLQSWFHPKEKHVAASASRVWYGAEISVSLLRQAFQVYPEHLRPHQEISPWPSAVL